ncbi:putative pectinesterase/pectinesterase inhibitor 51 isoform X2 [Curcuma longa]
MASPLLCSLLLFFLLLSTNVSGHRHHAHHRRAPVRPGNGGDASGANVSAAINLACRASRFPDLCESALSSLSPSLPPNPSAADLILAALAASSDRTKTARTTAEDILGASASDLNRTAAARNCLEFLYLADHRVGVASSALSAGDLPGARLFTGAVALHQYDCWSAYKYVNDTQQVADAMAFLSDLANLTSSAASMIAALQRYGANTWLWAPPQTERDGYWPDVAAASPQPEVFGAGGPGSWFSGDPDATVCKDGGEGCDFTTVQSAVDAAPVNSERRHVIYIKEGVYEETVRVPLEKPNLAFVGDGMGKTVITGSLNADTPGVSTYNTATVGVLGDGFMARDLTFENTAGPDAHQAVAFRSDSDQSILESVEFLGHQDTLYAHSLRQFYNACRIAGTVDFIFGNSATVFHDCLLVILPRQLKPEKGESNTVTAHGRTDPAQPTGFVFERCTVNGSEEYMRLYRSNPAVHRVYLGRPWKEYSRTVFIDSYLTEIVRPEGWMPWKGDFALVTLYYGESGSDGPGANVTARVPWSSQIPAEHLGVYSVENFIQGNRWDHSKDLRKF